MKADHYPCIKSESRGEYKEKGSKFLSFAFPIRSETEIKSLLDRFKKEYFDARHICYAYSLGTEKPIWKSTDAGEPSGSAGLPILNQIRSAQVQNVLVVVVRYFGGTKLGASGLANAYKQAAQEALLCSERVEVPLLEEISLHFPYLKMNEVMKFLKEIGGHVQEQSFTEQECHLKAILPKSWKKVLETKVREW